MSRHARIPAATALAAFLLLVLQARADDPWPAPKGTKFTKGGYQCKSQPSPQCWQGSPCQMNTVATCNGVQHPYLKADQWRQYGLCDYVLPPSSAYTCYSYDSITCAQLSLHPTSDCNQTKCKVWVDVGGGSICEP